MEDELHSIDFVDYHAVFAEALSYLGRGMNVHGSLEAVLRERYPLTHKVIGSEARLILSRLMEEREWGSVRALRELADRPELAEEVRRRCNGADPARGGTRPRRPGAIADYPRVFNLAQRKRQSGFSLDDSLDMAVRELHPQTFRKVKEGALFYVHLTARRMGMHELRALRELAENPDLFVEMDRSLSE